jgi:hypothetical protein
VSEASVTAGWADFFVASAGAAAALAGLVFVSISINLARVIGLPGVPGRAAETIVLLSGALAGSLVALVPLVSSAQMGVLLFAVTVPAWLAPMIIQAKTAKARAYQKRHLLISRALLHQVATLPGVLAGAALLGLLPGGIGWFAFAAVASMMVAMFNAWVLLVEIVR